MHYHSLTSTLSGVSLRQALLSAGAVEGNVFMPDSLPALPRAFFNNCADLRATEIAYVVCDMLFGSDLSSAAIKEIVDSALSFPIPLVRIEDGIYALELFHGPSMTIKDIPTRMLVRIMKALGINDLSLVIATSGNSGSAVANSIHNIDGIRAFVLFPKGTPRSIVARFTGLAGNVRAVEVDGTIEDCRAITRALMRDTGLNERYFVSTAASVNPGYSLTCAFLFIYAYACLLRLGHEAPEVQFSIPTANAATMAAALTARHMRLPMLPPIAACAASRPTIAYALDVTSPSNAPRIRQLGVDVIYSYIADAEIASTINDVYDRSGYTLDPHGATAYAALRRNLQPGAIGVALATAHPALSIDRMTAITGRAIELPLSLTRFMGIQPDTDKIPPTYPAFRRYLSKFH